MRLALFAALRFLQKLDHRGGSNNPDRFVKFLGEESLVAGHEKLGLARFSQRELVAVRWSMIQPSDALRAKSAQLVDRYDLRAADSFQLAAALEWCEDAPQGHVFLTADRRLREAARFSGFDAKHV